MLIRKLQNCTEITAADGTRLRELLHPNRDYQFSGRYSLAHARLAPGERSLEHVLKTDEVYYILEGSGQMHIDNESAPVVAGDAIEIPPGSRQYIENRGESDLCFLCIVDPAWRPEDEGICS